MFATLRVLVLGVTVFGVPMLGVTDFVIFFETKEDDDVPFFFFLLANVVFLSF